MRGARCPADRGDGRRTSPPSRPPPTSTSLLAATAPAGVPTATRTARAPSGAGRRRCRSYRILAEALANASRHAAGAPVDRGRRPRGDEVQSRRPRARRDAAGPGSGLGNLWTEYMKNKRKVEYMLLPRLARGLSEVLWGKKENNSWDEFEKRLLGTI